MSENVKIVEDRKVLNYEVPQKWLAVITALFPPLGVISMFFLSIHTLLYFENKDNHGKLIKYFMAMVIGMVVFIVIVSIILLIVAAISGDHSGERIMNMAKASLSSSGVLQ